MSAPDDDIETLARAIRLLSVSASCDSLDERGTRWARLRCLHRELGVLVDEYCHDLGAQLADTEYVRKDGYRLSDGTVIVHHQSSTERWQGRKLLRSLSTDMIEPTTGEAMPAVPLATLVEVLPAVDTDDATSSRWKLSGLRNLDIDPEVYRSRDWKPPRAELWRPR